MGMIRKKEEKWLILDVHSVLIPGSEKTILTGLSGHFGKPLWLTELRWLRKHEKNQTGKLHARSFYGYTVNRNISKREFEELIAKPYSKISHIPKPVLKELKKLKKNGWKLGILSNMSLVQAEFHRKQKSFDLFDLVLLSCDLGVMKPFPEIYSILEKKIKVPSYHIVFGDDLWPNVIVPYFLGWHAVKIKGSEELLRFLKDLEKVGISSE
jgi:putative hydrolase of the HAD superfamily